MRRFEMSQISPFSLPLGDVVGEGALGQQSNFDLPEVSFHFDPGIRVVDVVGVVMILLIQFLQLVTEGLGDISLCYAVRYLGSM